MSGESEKSSSSNYKKLRKGTRSCIECRQRKIRCIYRSTTSSACISCLSHGKRCLGQAEADFATRTPSSGTRVTLSERVAQLERELASLRSGTQSTYEARRPAINVSAQSHELYPSPEMGGGSAGAHLSALTSLPVISLFENCILNTGGATRYNDSAYADVQSNIPTASGIESTPYYKRSRIKRAKVCEILTEILPSNSTISRILETGSLWWNLLRQMHAYVCSEDPTMTLQRYVSHAFNQDDPAVLACAISFIILSMQCLRMNLDQSELPIPASELVDRYVSDIDRHVVSDDELSMSLEGIENILLQSQYYGNIGRPRKAWTIIRRGLSHSMLLGMHRCIVLPHARSPYLKRQESVWWHLLECDSYLSLLLGLPSFLVTCLYNSKDGAINTSEAMSASIFRRNLSIIVSAISQMSPEISPLSLLKTIEIDNQLRDLAHNMPRCWWDLVVPSRDNISEIMDLNERMNAQIWFYQAQAYLHLPFIVENIDNHSYEQNHEKCLQASREIMKIYIILREVLGATIHICRIIDFQTFTAAVILILGLLSRKHNITVDHSGQDKSDWNLIHQVVDAFRQVSVEDENLTAVQCLQSLEKLVSIGQGRFPTENEFSKSRIFIPYFGMISVRPGCNYTMAAARSETHQDGKPAREPPFGSAAEESLHIDIFNTPFLHKIVENCNMITKHPVSKQFPCHDAMATDIDQDWSWMLNEQYHSHS